MNLFAAYIGAWEQHDIPGVLATLTDGCVVTESYGPVYRGRTRVQEWMRKWFEQSGVVHSWVINRDHSHPDVLIAEWTFNCVWKEQPASFDGITIAIPDSGKICELREYATTAPLYEWKGAWLD